jgi:tripartite-type tricarboxylate transporter receptor subunit TctC
MLVARIVTSRLPERLGQQIVVDNRGGANAIIGTELACQGRAGRLHHPDGTL